MRTSRVFLAASVIAVVSVGEVRAVEPATALGGHCPVCLIKMGEVVQGTDAFSSVHDGKNYLFPGAKQKKMFDSNPAAFVPALGGLCTVCKVEMGKDVPGTVDHFVVHDSRLFLFPSEKQKAMFEANPAKYADADLAMGGNCPVCLTKMSEVVPGRPEYVSVYDGLRYLFPGPEQQQAFNANPGKFAPAFGGRCAVCKVNKNKEVAGDARFATTHNGRLYLFPSEKQKRMFDAQPSKYANADLALDGNCSVCKIEMGKTVKGKSSVAVDYRGKRYLFPGEKQRQMFVANPDKYAVND